MQKDDHRRAHQKLLHITISCVYVCVACWRSSVYLMTNPGAPCTRCTALSLLQWSLSYGWHFSGVSVCGVLLFCDSVDESWQRVSFILFILLCLHSNLSCYSHFSIACQRRPSPLRLYCDFVDTFIWSYCATLFPGFMFVDHQPNYSILYSL